MSFQICIKTDKPLQQLVTEIRDLLCLPPFRQNFFADSSYFQFELMGMLVLIHEAEEEEREPEVSQYPYRFDLQLSFTDHELDTDDMEYRLQPYYAQLLSFQLDVETAFHEKQKVGGRWQIRYRFFRKNPRWDGSILYGEPGWTPAVLELPPGSWRNMNPVF